MQTIEHKVACLRLNSAKEEVSTNLGKTITTLLQTVPHYCDVKKLFHSKTKMGVELALMKHISELAVAIYRRSRAGEVLD